MCSQKRIALPTYWPMKTKARVVSAIWKMWNYATVSIIVRMIWFRPEMALLNVVTNVSSAFNQWIRSCPMGIIRPHRMFAYSMIPLQFWLSKCHELQQNKFNRRDHAPCCYCSFSILVSVIWTFERLGIARSKKMIFLLSANDKVKWKKSLRPRNNRGLYAVEYRFTEFD